MSSSTPYILGLDLGTTSVGFALVRTEAGDGELPTPQTLLHLGCHIFDPGTDGTETDIAAGRDKPCNLKRRQARGRRRLLDRKTSRRDRLLRILKEAHLLPPGNTDNKEDRNRYFRRLDQELLRLLSGRIPDRLIPDYHPVQRLPYILRAMAVSEELQPYEYGRALYHLGQRRGFKSNRKSLPKEDETPGQVKAEITGLAKDMEAAGAPTLGAYLAGLDPHQARLRTRRTGREMYEQEFNAIWQAQAPRHPGLFNPELRHNIHECIFFQLPISSQKGLVGHCELEPGKRRAPWAWPGAQRFRMLSAVNNLEIITAQGEVRTLSPEERETLLAALETKGVMKFDAVRKLLKLKGAAFNLERGGESRLPGNSTISRILGAIADAWTGMDAVEKERLVHALMSYEDEDELARHLVSRWNLDPESAAKLATTPLEQGYCRLSRKAINALLPALETGERFATVKTRLYPRIAERQTCDILPPVQVAVPELRNPTVMRTLTEMRRVVNNVIKTWGKPLEIRVELARDVKRPREERARLSFDMRKREREREAIAKRIVDEIPHMKDTRRSDILKVQLAEECRWECPYTGKRFGMSDLFGPTPTVDIEHIIPFSRCLDDSYSNKTLCFTSENARKGKKTPHECYSDQDLEQILVRVRKFAASPSVKAKKLKLFELAEASAYGEECVSRHLNDTRYASRLAREYLGKLFPPDKEHLVRATSGGVTAWVRRLNGLEGLLGQEGKYRGDHRHHAIDAVAIALTGQGMIKRLADAAARPTSYRSRLFGDMEPAWLGIREDVKGKVLACVPSFRMSRKARGALHEETFYGRRRDSAGGWFFTIRKRLADMSPNEIGNIVDPALREAVAEIMRKAGKDKPKEVFRTDADHPHLARVDGSQSIVRRATIRLAANPVTVGQGVHARNVKLGENHHVSIFETAKGKWTGELVSLFEAQRRVREGQPVVNKIGKDGDRFLFSLCTGDQFTLEENDTVTYYIARSVSHSGCYPRIEYIEIHDARKKADIKKDGQWYSALLDVLRKRRFRKITVNSLGEIRRAND